MFAFESEIKGIVAIIVLAAFESVVAVEKNNVATFLVLIVL